MATTFEVYAGARRGNYSTLPTRDVEILADTHRCKDCGVEVVKDGGPAWSAKWVHVDGSEHGYVGLASRCTYCKAHDGVTFTHHAWHDATDCERCGGSSGYAIGD